MAKDDREAVGWTMGLIDEQINDLSLLKTGECVVSQDGDRKSFLCKVRKNESHESRCGGEVSAATIAFKNEYKHILDSIGDAIDKEDILFRDDLYAAMLAIGCQSCKANILNQVLPADHDYSSNLQQYYFAYWTQICREIWGFYGGSYKSYLAMYNAGLDLLKTSSGIEFYKSAFEDYFKTTKIYRQSAEKSVIGCAYEQLFLRKEVFVTINKHFDLIRNAPDKIVRLSKAIERVLTILLPSRVKISTDNAKLLVMEIVSRIPADIPPNAIWNNINYVEEN